MLLRPIARRLGALAAAALAVCLLAVPASGAQNYPHLGIYCYIQRDGQPLIDSTGVMNPLVASDLARFHELIIDVDPLWPYRPDVLQALHRMNPQLKILAYVTGHYIWPSDDPDSLNHYPTRYWNLVRNLGGFLYDKQGNLYPLDFADVNLAKRDARGNYVVAESLAVLFWQVGVQNGNWDGIFLDTFCEHILWAQTATESIDYVRAGYSTPAAFDAAWKAGGDTLAARLRALSGPVPVLVGNCATATKYAWFNGWNRENFPYQNGGSWYSNMLDGGYLADDLKYRAPTNDLLFTEASPASMPYWAGNIRRARYGLGSATLGDGYHHIGNGAKIIPYMVWSWWYDEYAVDLATGRSDTTLAHTGWLGQPLDSWYQMIWLGTNPDGVTNPGFETDLTGWTQYAAVPASMTRDTTTAAVGGASLHEHITVPSTVEWQVTASTTGSLALTAWQPYSATFWAKASSPRTFAVVANDPAVGEYARAYATVGTSWKQYQVALMPGSSGSAKLQFFLARDAGDVWLDDVHFQSGATTLYRRDFQNGVVLVNPSSTPLTVPLGAGYKNILGIQDPVTNDGATVTSVTVNPGDAHFLLTTGDVTPPAVTTDLHVKP